jgi:hypothetical protein
MPALAQYAGPAILSRGEAPTAMGEAQITFRPYLDVTALYDTGLTGVLVTPNGTLANTAAGGVGLTAGISGTHSWKHTRVGLDYQGSYYHFNRQTYYDGANQSLMLDVTQQFSRHVSLSLRETAGMFAQGFGLLGLPQTVSYDPTATSYVPVTDYFDNRTIYTATQADVIIQRSTRLSFDFGGDGFLVRRRSTALYGVTGATARADVQYRLTRHTTVGGDYTYTHYGFTRVFGATDLHAFSGTYAVQLTRTVEFTGYAGAMRMETKFLQNVPIDPAIVALLGIQYGTQVVHGIQWIPNIGGRLSKTFRHGVVYASGGHTATPGNGLFLTSSVSSFGAGYGYSGFRKWSLGAGISYNYANSVANIVGNYTTTSASLTASHQLGRMLHMVMNFSGNKYGSGTFSLYNKIFYQAEIGVAFAPGDYPLRVW